MYNIQCGTIITRSFFPQNTNNRASYGVSFANSNSDLCSKLIPIMMLYRVILDSVITTPGCTLNRQPISRCKGEIWGIFLAFFVKDGTRACQKSTCSFLVLMLSIIKLDVFEIGVPFYHSAFKHTQYHQAYHNSFARAKLWVSFVDLWGGGFWFCSHISDDIVWFHSSL